MSAERKDAAPRPEARMGEARLARIDRLIRDVEDAASRVGEWYADEDDEAPFEAVSASLESARHFLNEALLSDYARLAAVERERNEARRALDFIRLNCRVIYHPPLNEYPVEHSVLAGKDQWDEIARAALAARPAETPEGR